jgi:hypothetical protein
LAKKLIYSVFLKGQLQYSPISFVIVKLSFYKDLDEDTFLQVEVTDQGNRMTRLQQASILKPLTSLGKDNLDKCNLSDIRSICKAINAKLEVREQLLCTQFFLTLPVTVL